MLFSTSTTLFLDNNISWIKDLFTIFFSGTAILLAILTYKRAKETLFQPVRSEVMKKQTDLLVRLLTILEHEFREKLDYKELIYLNTESWLFDYGFIFSEDVKHYLKKTIAGSVFFTDKQGKINVTRIEAFSNSENKKESTFDDRKKMYEKAKKGDIKIDAIHLTKQHIEIVIKIHEFADNPFMPSIIVEELRKLIVEIKINTETHLRSTIEWVIEEVIKRENKTGIKFDGVFNEFNKRSIHHIETLKNIKLKIRNYLQIDSTPWSK